MEDFKKRKNYENEGDDDDEYMKKVNGKISYQLVEMVYTY